MLPLDVIRKYYSDLSDEDLKKIQVFIYELCCGLMQYFYGNDGKKHRSVKQCVFRARESIKHLLKNHPYG